jgi:hypothetical protein
MQPISACESAPFCKMPTALPPLKNLRYATYYTICRHEEKVALLDAENSAGSTACSFSFRYGRVSKVPFSLSWYLPDSSGQIPLLL